MTLVVGTAGHIDHGKTTLLRALTGIDADRLPEERRRGMTIDVGYAHMVLPDGEALDFVDVPGHDRLIGNMLVGAGEIDAALLVVAAADGPRAQTREHLELIDALGIGDGVVAVTKADLVDAERLEAVVGEVGALLATTTLSGAPIVAVSSTSGAGMDGLLAALIGLRSRAAADGPLRPPRPFRLAIDRAFTVKGRGLVVTGTARGEPIAVGAHVRLEPSGVEGRIRGIEVHGDAVDRTVRGRTALNLAGIDEAAVRRGMVVGPLGGPPAGDRWLVAIRPPAALPGRRDRDASPWPPPDGSRVRVHAGTDAAGGRLGLRGREAAGLPDGRPTVIVRLERPMAIAAGDRFILRRPSPAALIAAGTVLDPEPARGAGRRRVTRERIAVLATALAGSDEAAIAAARLGLHGALISTDGVLLAPDLANLLEAAAEAAVAAHHEAQPSSPGLALGVVRRALQATLRRTTGLDGAAAATAADATIDQLVAGGRLARDGDRLRDPARPGGAPPELAAAMDRLEAILAVAGPPPLSAAARAAACPPDGVRALIAAGRVIRLEADLAWATATYRGLAAAALAMAREAPLTPAAFRDATHTSRKFVLAVLEDLDRRGILARTAEGHVPGPRAPNPIADAE